MQASRLPVASISLFEFRAFDRLQFYSFVNYYLASPRVTFLYTLFAYGPSDRAGFPGLRDLTFLEALLWPQLATVRLLWAFKSRSPILSTVGAYSQLIALAMDYLSLVGSARHPWRQTVYTTATRIAQAIAWRIVWPILPWWLCDLVRGAASETAAYSSSLRAVAILQVCLRCLCHCSGSRASICGIPTKLRRGCWRGFPPSRCCQASAAGGLVSMPPDCRRSPQASYARCWSFSMTCLTTGQA